MSRLLSLRVLQTVLFVAVVLVALAMLATWIHGALSAQIAEGVREQQLKDAVAVAQTVAPDFPLSSARTLELRDHVDGAARTFGADVRVYDLGGRLVASRESLALPERTLEAAMAGAAGGARPFASVDLGAGGVAVAAAPVLDASGRERAIVVVAGDAAQARETLDTARRQLLIGTAVTLFVAGLIGLGFSDFIARQAGRLVSAADRIAAGDFSGRLPNGPFPLEIRELVDASNRMAEQLGDAFEKLRGQEAAQREFVANASHELRTPIAALQGAIEILETGGKDKPDVRDEFLATMRVEAKRLQRLVDNLFTLAQVDSGRLHLHLEPVPADEVAWVVSTAMRPLANDAGVALQADIPPGDLAVVADRDRLTQVLLGFADNAVKHSRPGDIVTVAVAAVDGHVRFAVSDTGAGIPADVLPHIFDRFYTQRKAAEGRSRGSGLGLAIAAEILEAHGSRIEVDTAEGRGTTFAFALPRARGAAQP